MGLPSINVSFASAAKSSVKKSSRGVVGLILIDPLEGPAILNNVKQISQDYTDKNAAYIERAFIGYSSAPKQVVVYGAPTSADIKDALAYFSTVKIDWIAGPPESDSAIAEEIRDWIIKRRKEDFTVKAVLPNVSANNEGIVNFTTNGIEVDGIFYSAAEYCSRIAGILAGTALNISCTYAPLYEVQDIERLTQLEMDTAINNGELILLHDGIKTKIARGVNSLQTITDKKNDAWKKIKILETIDMIHYDLRMLMQDEYIGKYANSYDNKCLLITAIKAYLEGLEMQGVLLNGSSQVGIDIEAQTAYLEEDGVDTSEMNEQEIKEADTGDNVFLAANIRILDAIEDIALHVTI